LEKRKIFVPAITRTLEHPDGGRDAVHTTTPRLPKYQPTGGHDGQPQPIYNLERNHVLTAKEALWTGTKNLVPTMGFNPQTVLPIASSCTHIMKA
jgi:hypothetical protein